MFLIFTFSSSHGLFKHNDAAIRIVIWKFYFKTLPPLFFLGGGGGEKMGKPTTYNFYVAYYL